MDGLTSLPNIGPVLAEHLRRVGIETPEQLRAAGSREALLRIRAQVDPGACLHQLQALEGAVQGIRKTQLSPACKSALKEFHQSLK